MTDEAPPVAEPVAEPVVAPAPTERGWGKLLLALAAFVLLPQIPQLQALLPVKDTMLLFVPAVAACALVGWWAGGRAFLAIAWVAVAVLVLSPSGPANPYSSLVRGWSLLLAGSFGLVCLFSDERPLFTRALVALGLTLGLATIMSVIGPVSPSRAAQTVGVELGSRDAALTSTLDSLIKTHPAEWTDLTTKFPQFSELPAETTKELEAVSGAGKVVFPALLALESLIALALAWATYHRLGRTRLGAPLRPLRDFRFNDQLVWGLIAGLTIVLLPTMTALSDTGKNLLVFFGALYAVRGLGVLSWFMAPGSLGVTLVVGFVMLCAPVLNAFAALGFVMLGVASLALGLGDTWADWRNRARPVSHG